MSLNPLFELDCVLETHVYQCTVTSLLYSFVNNTDQDINIQRTVLSLFYNVVDNIDQDINIQWTSCRVEVYTDVYSPHNEGY